MSFLLTLSRLIDALTERIGKLAMWFILATTMISAGNAIVRKLFDTSSNAFLEIQWYLFAAVFLLAAGYTMLRQEHVKIDVILGRFSKRTQIKVEIFGIVVFLLPFVLAVVGLVWPLVVKAYVSGEMSSNAGGLIRWPVYALVPAGFALLEKQAVRGPWLLGYGESNDAHHMSTPHPEGLGARIALSDALKRAALQPAHIDYINLHGTASQKNDEVEAKVVAETFPSNTFASSTKGWMGHTLGAAGIVEAAISLLALDHGLLPGTLNAKTLDPACGPQIQRENVERKIRSAVSFSFVLWGVWILTSQDESGGGGVSWTASLSPARVL